MRQCVGSIKTEPASGMKFLDVARDSPDHAIYVANETGAWQVWAWDRKTGIHRQQTNHPHGASYTAISPNKERIAWFDDPDGNEKGVWREQFYPSWPGEDRLLSPDLSPAHPKGIVVGNEATFVGLSSHENGFSVHRVRDGKATQLYHHPTDTIAVRALSMDEKFLALQDSGKHPDFSSVRVIDAVSGEPKGALALPNREFVPVAFLQSPPPFAKNEDPWLLVQHDLHRRRELLLFNPLAEELVELPFDMPGELANRWRVFHYDQLARCTKNGNISLVMDHGARTILYNYDLKKFDHYDDSFTPTRESGDWVHDAASMCNDIKYDYSFSGRFAHQVTNGTIQELTSNDAEAICRISGIGEPWRYDAIELPGGDHPSFGRNTTLFSARQKPIVAPTIQPTELMVQEVAMDGPRGPISVIFAAIVAREGACPETAFADRPAIVGAHGGPRDSAKDAWLWQPYHEVMIRGGVVVLFNYGGSDGYGAKWRLANNNLLGYSEAQDLSVVLKHSYNRRLIDLKRTVVAGCSWGATVSLLYEGIHSVDLPVAGVLASSPVCDQETRYYDPLVVPEHRRILAARFGGTPEENPGAWELGSPLTYVDGMHDEILITYNRNDPRCGPAQVEKRFLPKVSALGKNNIRALPFSGGHNAGTQSVTESNRILDAQLNFVYERLGLDPEDRYISPEIFGARIPIGVPNRRAARPHPQLAAFPGWDPRSRHDLRGRFPTRR